MEKMLITPAEQRVIVYCEKSADEVRKSGIIIPMGAENKRPEVGVIVAIGKGSLDHPMNYRAGQKIIYSQYAGLEVKLNIDPYGENIYKIMNQLDIMAVITEVDL